MNITNQLQGSSQSLNPRVDSKSHSKPKARKINLLSAWVYTTIAFIVLATTWVVMAYMNEGLLIKEILIACFIISMLLILKGTGGPRTDFKKNNRD